MQRKKASASVLANMRRLPGTVTIESEAIFEYAREKLKNISQPIVSCPTGCSPNEIPYMYFHSAPQKTLDLYPDKDHCTALEQETKINPIRYSNYRLHSVEEIVKWIGELAQGKGQDGTDLYKRCDKSCSPKYEYEITKENLEDSTFIVSATIICGAARDKDDNTYALKSFFRWFCEKSP